jgi:hypothetical protein
MVVRMKGQGVEGRKEFYTWLVECNGNQYGGSSKN